MAQIRKREILSAILALVLACLAQQIWMSELNFFVWKITYIGEQTAFLLAPPNYDSPVSVRIFDAIAIIINALVYAAVLWAVQILLRRWKLRRSARKAAAVK
jgi:hypothetical protein